MAEKRSIWPKTAAYDLWRSPPKCSPIFWATRNNIPWFIFHFFGNNLTREKKPDRRKSFWNFNKSHFNWPNCHHSTPWFLCDFFRINILLFMRFSCSRFLLVFSLHSIRKLLHLRTSNNLSSFVYLTTKTPHKNEMRWRKAALFYSLNTMSSAMMLQNLHNNYTSFLLSFQSNTQLKSTVSIDLLLFSNIRLNSHSHKRMEWNDTITNNLKRVNNREELTHYFDGENIVFFFINWN